MPQRRNVGLRLTTRLVAAGLLACVLRSPIAAQVLPVGPEFQANTYATGYQTYVSVAAAGNGDFVVVWDSVDQDGNSYGVFAQRYSAAFGTPIALGSEFQVNTHTTSYQGSSAVAAATNGDFVVVWAGVNQDGAGDGVFAQRYASGGGAIGTEFRVNTYTLSNQLRPAVAAAGNGDFVVAWKSDFQDGYGSGVFGQRFASGGSPLGTEFLVNTYTSGGFFSQGNPDVAAGSNGDFMAVWQSDGQDGSDVGVFAQRFASSGSPSGSEFQVNSYTSDVQRFPAVAAASNGDFVVVWESGQDGSGFGVFGQRYSSGGVRLGTEFQLNTYTTDGQSTPDVAVAGNGDLVVVWHSDAEDGSSYGVFGKRYAADGSPLGTEFKVNTYTQNDQLRAAVAAGPNGDFVVAWESDGQDGSDYGIFGQRFAADCPDTPIGICTAPAKSLLLIKDQSPAGGSAKDKLIWKWLKGPVTPQGDYGFLLNFTRYRLCIYTGAAQTLTMTASVPPIVNWQAISTKGYKYKDPTATTAGVTQILLNGGGATSKILVKGKDGTLDLEPGTLPLDGSADVIVQLSNSTNTNCWEATFPTTSVKKTTATQFKAKTQ